MVTVSKNELIQRYHQVSRALLLITVAALIGLSMIMWQLELVIQGRTAMLVGALLMLGALWVFQLPRISFMIWKRRHREELQQFPMLAPDWPQFRDELTRHS